MKKTIIYNYYIINITIVFYNINMSYPRISLEECDCINGLSVDIHLSIQRKLDAGIINKAVVEFLHDWLIRIQLETGVFESRYKTENVNRYKRQCIHLLNFIEKTYPGTE